MSLILPTTTLSLEQLQEFYSEHRQGISEMLGTLEKPEARIVDEARWLLVRDLAADALRVLPDARGLSSEPDLRDRVNLSYDLMIVIIELAKSCLDVPKVPRRRTPVESLVS
jgi:hypothetical protein